MPTRTEIVEGIVSIANTAQPLAIAWHLLLGLLIVALAFRWRPSNRLTGLLLAAPFMSVSTLAWSSGNPFNAAVFAIVTALLVLAARAAHGDIRIAPGLFAAPGALLVAYGWVYPHFLDADSWTAYLYSSPFGLIPCPTLAAVIGLTLVLSNLGSAAWSATLAIAGLLYGVIGVFGLGVSLDYGLVAGAAVLGFAILSNPLQWRSVRATREERTRRLPGDDLIPDPLASFTHAITIEHPPVDVWPWIIQMGAGTRAGWYSYDALDNGRRRSATRIVPALQDIGIGTLFPALPGITEGFTVLGFESTRFLILGWPSPDKRHLVTWTFALFEHDDDACRVVVRVRGASQYRFRGLPPLLSKYVARAVHYVMQRRQLLGVAARVERSERPERFERPERSKDVA